MFLSEQYLTERFVGHRVSMSYDLKKFESGKNNVLLLVGVFKDGIPEVESKLAKRYNATIINFDNIVNDLNIDTASIDDIKLDVGSQLIKTYVDIINTVTKNKNKRYILSGLQFMMLLAEMSTYKSKETSKLLKVSSAIVSDTSAFRSAFRLVTDNMGRMIAVIFIMGVFVLATMLNSTMVIKAYDKVKTELGKYSSDIQEYIEF